MPVPMPPPPPVPVVTESADLETTRSEVRETLARLRQQRRTVKHSDSTLIRLRDNLRATRMVDAEANRKAIEG